MEVTPVERAILKALAEKRPLDEIAKAAGTSRVGVGQAVAKLQIMGLISDKGALTDKGLDALSGGEP